MSGTQTASVEGRPMTRITKVAALVLSTLLWAPARPAAQAGAEVALRAAMETETVKGDLKAAIEQYRTLAKSADRAIAAQALVRMAGCHQKLGGAQAKAIYEQVARDYADQKEAVAIARAYLRGNNGGSRSVRGDRAVWTGPEVDMFGRVSPDGTFITYVDWGGAGNLMLHDLATGTNRALTAYNTAKPYSEFAEGSVVSPDGREVVYSWFSARQRRELRRIRVNGAGIPEPAVVYTTGDDVAFIWPMDWSSDGKWIATAVSRKDGTGQIALVGAGDGSFRVLKTVNWKGPARMFFSRDSRYIAYDLATSETSSQRDVFVMAVSDGREVPAIVHAASEDVVAWSTDGRQLLFSSDRTGSVGLWAQTITDGKPVGPAEMLKADIGAVFSLGLAAEGTLYGYKSVGSRDVRIAGIDLNAGRLQEEPRAFTQGFVAGATVPDWSPDGRFLAYQGCGDRACVAIRSVETGHVRTLQRGLLFTSSPRWSPDGRTLITAARDRQGRNGIFRIDAQTGEFTNVVYGPGFPAQPQWSKDGAKIYYVHDGVIERDLTTGANRLLLPPLASRSQLALSPDGRFLALAGLAFDSGSSRLLQILPTGGGEPRELLRLTDAEKWGAARTVAWTPDSRAVIVMKNTQARNELWVAPVDGGTPRRLDIDADIFTRDADGGLDQGFSLSPDGRQIAFLSGKSAAEVWALENFLPPVTAVKR
jgi:Tol biopolymer transport system component